MARETARKSAPHERQNLISAAQLGQYIQPRWLFEPLPRDRFIGCNSSVVFSVTLCGRTTLDISGGGNAGEGSVLTRCYVPPVGSDLPGVSPFVLYHASTISIRRF